MGGGGGGGGLGIFNCGGGGGPDEDLELLGVFKKQHAEFPGVN